MCWSNLKRPIADKPSLSLNNIMRQQLPHSFPQVVPELCSKLFDHVEKEIKNFVSLLPEDENFQDTKIEIPYIPWHEEDEDIKDSPNNSLDNKELWEF